MSEPRYSLEIDARRRAPARVQHPENKLWYYATGRRGTAYHRWSGDKNDNLRVYEYAYAPAFPRPFGAGPAVTPVSIWVWLDGQEVRVLTDFEIEGT